MLERVTALRVKSRGEIGIKREIFVSAEQIVESTAFVDAVELVVQKSVTGLVPKVAGIPTGRTARRCFCLAQGRSY